ncbi:MAG TPA: hypothetical protein DIU10_03850 [Sulfitobacter sp.]|nr:hypothetical protein [Sulfitobacter sp.]
MPVFLEPIRAHDAVKTSLSQQPLAVLLGDPAKDAGHFHRVKGQPRQHAGIGLTDFSKGCGEGFKAHWVGCREPTVLQRPDPVGGDRSPLLGAQ